MDKKDLNTVSEIVDELFQQLGISTEVEIENAEEGVSIILHSNESGILIGYHGETLEALQLITSLIVSKRLNSFIRISLEIGEYKKNRSDYLKHLVEQTKAQVIAEGIDSPLPNLKSWERRIVHMLLQNDPDVVSESTGEGRDRVLVIKQKK